MKLPNFLCPKYKCELIRLGKENDGGYSVPNKSLGETKNVFGFGLGDDWSFEEDFYNRTKSKIYCYDHTVNWKFFLKLFLGHPKTIFKFFEYKK